MGKIAKLLTWPMSAYIAFVFVWYLQYKFTAAQGSVDLFTTLTDWLGFHGYEKVMRIGTGSAELIASIILFIPGFMTLGALGSLAIMTGAIFFHVVSPLGIDPYGDGGHLFKEACAVWSFSVIILLIRREEAIMMLSGFPVIGGIFRPLAGRPAN